jgi:hypothetical protein
MVFRPLRKCVTKRPRCCRPPSGLLHYRHLQRETSLSGGPVVPCEFGRCIVPRPARQRTTAYGSRQRLPCHLCRRDAARRTNVAYSGAASASHQNRSEIQSATEHGCYVRLLRSAQNRKAAQPLCSRIRLDRPDARQAWVRRIVSADQPSDPGVPRSSRCSKSRVQILTGFSAPTGPPSPAGSTAPGGKFIALLLQVTAQLLRLA